MRKILGIMLSLLLLVPAIKLSLDRHYCSGELADVKISISGKLATCGMENEDMPHSHLPIFTVMCCEDQLTILSTDYRYYPENLYYNNLKLSSDIPAEAAGHLSFLMKSVIETSLNFLPPGRSFPHGPEQAEICLFRI